jgi:hypothetical protein
MPLGFLVPAFLAGLAALAIPVLLHLRRHDRRRPIKFPSLRFLAPLPVQTEQKRRITDWPLLLLRAVALALLAMAFARPFLRQSSEDVAADAGLTVLLVDRSASIGVEGSESAQRDSLVAVIERIPDGRRVALVAFDATASILVQPTTDRAAIRAALATLPEPGGTTRFSAALRAASQLLAAERVPGGIVLISDLQQSGFAAGATPGLPSGTDVVAIQVEPVTRDNTAITALELEPIPSASGRRVVAAARIARFGGDQPRSIDATLVVDGREVASRRVSVDPDAVVRVQFDTVAIARGESRVGARITADGFRADDSYHVIVAAEAATRVLLVVPRDARVDEFRYLERALEIGRDPQFEVERVTSLEPGRLAQAGAVVMLDVAVPEGVAGDALADWLADGGGLVVAPGDRIAGRRTVPDWLPARTQGGRERNAGAVIGDPVNSHPAVAGFQGDGAFGIGRARIRRHTVLEPVNNSEVLLRFDDATPALVTGTMGEGRVAVVGIPLDGRRGDFPLQPGFLPFVRGVVGWAAGAGSQPTSIESGQAWLAPASIRSPVVRTPSGDVVRPQGEGRSVTLRETGVHEVHDGGVSGLPSASLAVNLASGESNLQPGSADELLLGVTDIPLAEGARSIDEAFASEARQSGWRWILLALALLLMVEVLVASRGWRGVGTVMIPGQGGRDR